MILRGDYGYLQIQRGIHEEDYIQREVRKDIKIKNRLLKIYLILWKFLYQEEIM